MKYTEFKKHLENDKEFSIYLFEGEDAYFRESGVFLLKNKFISNPELNFVNLDSDCSVNEIVSSLTGYPFMSKKRMTLMREFYPKQEHFKNGLKGYLENPFNESLFVIVNEKPTEIFKKYSSVCVVNCEKADTALLIKWIKAECARSSVKIDDDAAKLISEFCLSDMTRIKSETEKLISYVGNNASISTEQVKQMVAQQIEYKIYELTDFIAKMKFDEALSIIKDLMTKGEQVSRLVNYIYNYYRKLLHVAISDMSTDEIAKAFGIKEYAVKKLIEQSRMFKKRALKSAVDMLSEADYQIKSGSADADDYFYLTIFKIMTEK